MRATVRSMMSTLLPAAEPEMNSTGRSGFQACAAAGPARNNAMASTDATVRGKCLAVTIFLRNSGNDFFQE